MGQWRQPALHIAKKLFDRASGSNTSPSPATPPKGSGSIVAGLIAGSVFLIAFGLDRLIEVTTPEQPIVKAANKPPTVNPVGSNALWIGSESHRGIPAPAKTAFPA